MTQKPKLSFVIPCFNDASTVAEAIKSIYMSYDHDLIDLTVIDDKSTDHSLQEIKKMQKNYPFTIITHEINTGKAHALNQAIPHLPHDLVVLIDADIVLNRPALENMLSRLQHNPKVATVSAPYKPFQKTFFASLQAIDYVMFGTFARSFNRLSALNLWGGCCVFRKKAFLEVKGFTVNALSEDFDFAYKLYEKKRKIQQCKQSVATHTPETLRTRYKQRKRRNIGSTHCYLKHRKAFLSHPMQILFLLTFSLMNFINGYQFIVFLRLIYDLLAILSFSAFIDVVNTLRLRNRTLTQQIL